MRHTSSFTEKIGSWRVIANSICLSTTDMGDCGGAEVRVALQIEGKVRL